MLVDLLPKIMYLVFSFFDKVTVPISIFGDFGDGRSRSRSVQGARPTQAVPVPKLG